VGVVRTIIQFFGLLCVALAVLVGLLALFGFMVSDDTTGRVVAGVFGGVALLFLVVGARALRHPGRSASIPPARPKGLSGRRHSGSQYQDFEWGNPPPSRKQFRYAMSLGAEVRHGMTKWMLSDAIDEAIEQQRSGEPATREQLRTIRAYHGVVPRAVTRGEARRIIEFLEDYSLPCRFCGIEVVATDDACCACAKSLRAMRIPIKL
jgi:hypothetical protein